MLDMTSTAVQSPAAGHKPKSRLSPVGVLTKRQRSAMANGDTLITGVDARSAEARRFRDLCISFAAPLGGFTGLAEHDAALVRHAAALTMQSEQMQREAVRGEPVDTEQLVRVTNLPNADAWRTPCTPQAKGSAFAARPSQQAPRGRR